MSVVLDALHRARQGRSPVSSTRPPSIPAGLRVGTGPRPKVSPPRQVPWGPLIALVLAGAAIWAGVQFGPVLLRQRRATAAAAAEAARAAAQAAQAAQAAVAKPTQPTISDMLARMQEPQVIAPRAMGRPTSATATPPRLVRPPARAAVVPPARPLLVAPAARALTTVPVAAAPFSPTVDEFALAVRYHGLGNFEQALKHYLAVLDREEFNVEARNNLGLLYHERGLVAESVDQFRRAILINPSYLKARGNLAVVLMNAGRLPEARAELRAALAMEPRNVDLLVNMALVDKADRQPDQAREMLVKALGYQPKHAVAHYNLAMLYEESGDFAKAADHYTEFLKYAGPEHGALLSDVQRKIDALMPR